jgi:hypothetical protein
MKLARMAAIQTRESAKAAGLSGSQARAAGNVARAGVKTGLQQTRQSLKNDVGLRGSELKSHMQGVRSGIRSNLEAAKEPKPSPEMGGVTKSLLGGVGFKKGGLTKKRSVAKYNKGGMSTKKG